MREGKRRPTGTNGESADEDVGEADGHVDEIGKAFAQSQSDGDDYCTGQHNSQTGEQQFSPANPIDKGN